MPKPFIVEISGNLPGILTLAKQINFAAYRATNDLLERSQKNIQSELDQDLIIRTGWMKPGTRYGINARFAKVKTLEGQVGTAADWLLEEEGYHGGVKRPDSFSPNVGRTPSTLAEPIVGNARPTLHSKMPVSQKAGKLLANPQRTKAFIVRSKKTGQRIVLQRVGETASGTLLRDKRGNLRIGRKSERARTRVVLKAVLRPSVRVPQKHIFVKTAVKTMNVNHYGDRFGKNLIKALQTAKVK